MIWFTADQHFWHSNIIKYCDRPHSDVKEMNRDIVDKYNEVVNENDTVYFLGDLMLGGMVHKNDLEILIDKMPGEKFLIVGNHDRLPVRAYIDVGFSGVYTEKVGFDYLMTHDPTHAELMQYGGFALTAHCHNAWKKRNRCVNVDLDVSGFYPMNKNAVSVVASARLNGIDYVCAPCALSMNGKIPEDVPTTNHEGKCDVCGTIKGVCPASKWRFDWRL